MIISPESPLRRIPDNLDPRQACFLDGIRISVEMSDISYTRLCDQLWELARTFEAGKQLPAFDATQLFLDAWSIIDATHRLRSVLEAMPGLKKSGPIYQGFIRATEPATSFRNTVQHLREELVEMAGKSWPVWGVLTWLAVVKPDGALIRSCSVHAGRLQTSTHRLLNPAGQQFKAAVDHVTLQSKDQLASLSEFIRSTERVIRPVEKALAKYFPDCSSCGSDLMVCVDMSFPTTESSTPSADEQKESARET